MAEYGVRVRGLVQGERWGTQTHGGTGEETTKVGRSGRCVGGGDGKKRRLSEKELLASRIQVIAGSAGR